VPGARAVDFNSTCGLLNKSVYRASPLGAIILGHVEADLAITGGVHSAGDVIKSVMAGARVAMMASVLRKAPHSALETKTKTRRSWLRDNWIAFVEQFSLPSYARSPWPEIFR
jgi:hypothetical protein